MNGVMLIGAMVQVSVRAKWLRVDLAGKRGQPDLCLSGRVARDRQRQGRGNAVVLELR